MDTSLSRANWAAEEQVRRKAATSIAKKARINLGSRQIAREMFVSIKSCLNELRDAYDHEMSFDAHAEYREPSIPNALSGEYYHNLLSENKKMKRLFKALWSYSNAQYNPENSCRDLVDKCILCLDGAMEWPPTMPSPPYPKPQQRISTLVPKLGNHKQELSGLKGSVVDVIRHAVNDRLIERAMSKDDKSSKLLIPKPRREVMKRLEIKSYAQSFDEEDSESESESSSSDSSSSSNGDDDSNDSDSDGSGSSGSMSGDSRDSATTANPYNDLNLHNDKSINVSIVNHAKRLLLRPRRLRERRPKPDVDAHHSVIGTTALIAACQFEDIPFENASIAQTPSTAGSYDGSSFMSQDQQSRGNSKNGASEMDSVCSRGSRRNKATSNSSNPIFPTIQKASIRRSGKSVASTLLKLGTDVNFVGQEGMAALHAAAAQGNMNTIKRLIQSGAHRGIRDKYGRRADQVIIDELPKEKREALMLLLRDLPTPPPPCRLLTSLPTSVELTWNILDNFPGEYELIAHRLSLRITTPQAVSVRWKAAVESLSKDLVKRTEAEEGLKVRARVEQGAQSRHFYLPLKAQLPLEHSFSAQGSQTSNSGIFFPPLSGSSVLPPPQYGSLFSTTSSPNVSEPSSPLSPSTPYTPLSAASHNPSSSWNKTQHNHGQHDASPHRHHSHHSGRHHHSGHHKSSQSSAHSHGSSKHHHHHHHHHHHRHLHHDEPHACISNDKGSIISNEHGEHIFVENFVEGSESNTIDNGGSNDGSSMLENTDGLIVKYGSPPLTLTGLVPYTTYGLRLSSESKVGCSLPSLETMVFTKGEVPTPCGTAFQVGMTRTSITIMWIPPEYNNGSPVEAYEVRRFLPENPTTEMLEEIDKPDKFFPHLGNSTRYRIDGEENYTQIKFRELYPSARFTIRAKNAVGWSPFSVLSPAFSAGDSIRVVELGGTYIKIEWDTPPGLNILRFGLQKRYYTMVLKEDQYHDVDDDIVPRLDGTPVKYTISGLKPGSKHQIRIRSSDSSGWRPWKTSLVSEVMQCACDVPFPPEEVEAALHYTGGKVPPSNSLQTAHNNCSEKESLQSKSSIGDVSVEARDESSEEAYSVMQDAPSISLKWTPGDSNGSPIEEYEVSWSHDSGMNVDGMKWKRMALTRAAKYVAQEVVLGGSYIFRIRASNSHGWSEYSEISNSLTVFRVLPPMAPEVLQDEISGLDIPPGVTFLRLTWKPPPGKPASEIDSYEMQFLDEKGSSSSDNPLMASSTSSTDKKSSSGPATLNWQPISNIGGPIAIKGAGVEKPSQIMQGLLPGHKYRFRIRALAFEGWTDWSVPSEIMSTDRRF